MSVQPLVDVRADLWGTVQRILRTHVPQHEVWAFGSRVNGAAKPYSDLDLAVVTQHPLPLDVLGALRDAFGESDLPWRVDVVDWACTSESFRRIIEQNKVVVQQKDGIKSREETIYRVGRARLASSLDDDAASALALDAQRAARQSSASQ
jgi:type I restriction enzyme S subunit